MDSDRRTYVVLSDGELQEGSTWEAVMMAANLKLSNLTVFLDLNDFSGLERMSKGHPAFYPIEEKFRAFSWDVHKVDGHQSSAIFNAGISAKNKPTMVVCQTVKGKGVSYMENVPIWHYRSPSPAEYKQALEEIAAVAVE